MSDKLFIFDTTLRDGEQVPEVQGFRLVAAGSQRGTQVHQLQLQSGGAPEGVGLQIEGCIHPAAGLQLSGGLRHGEENGKIIPNTMARAISKVSSPFAQHFAGIVRISERGCRIINTPAPGTSGKIPHTR